MSRSSNGGDSQVDTGTGTTTAGVGGGGSGDTWTVCGWFRSPDNSAGSDFASMYEERDNGDDPYITIQMKQSGAVAAFYRPGGFAQPTVLMTSATGFDDSIWHSFCFVKRASNDYEWYIDGTSEGTDTTSITNTVTRDRVNVGPKPGNTNGLPSGGLLSHFANFSEDLTIDEAEGFLYTGRCRIQPNLWWTLNEQGSTESDWGGRSNTGTMTSMSLGNSNPPTVPVSFRMGSGSRSKEAISMTSDGNVLSGYGATGTTDAAIRNSTDKDVTITVQNASTSEHTYRNIGDSTTTVLGSVSLTITVVDTSNSPIDNARVGIFDDTTLEEYMNTLTNASGIATATYTGGTPNGVFLRARKNSSADNPRYKPFNQPQTIGTGGLTATISLSEDVNAT